MKSTFKFLFGVLKSKHTLSLISNGINALVGIVTFSILYRFLTSDEVGNWGFFLTILLLVDTFRSGFLTTAFVKFYAGSSEDRQNEIVGSSWFIAILITLGLIVLNIPAYFLSIYVKDPSFTLFLKFFGINYILSLPFFVSNCVLQGKQRFDRLLILNFSNQGTFLISLIVVIALGKIDIYSTLYCYLFANLLSSLIALFSGWTGFSKLRFRTSSAIKEIYHFGKFSVGTNLSATLLGTADSFIIKLFLGPAALAVYGAGTKLTQIVEIPLRSFIYTAMPTLSARYNSGQKSEVIRVMKKYVGMLSILLMPVFILVFIFADYAILIIGGKNYAITEAPNILRIYMFIAILYPAERFFALTLDVIHLPKINFKKVILMVLVTVVTDLVAVKLTNSVYGIAVSSIFTTASGMLIAFYAINKYYQKFTLKDLYKEGYQEVILMVKDVLSKLKAK